MHPVLLRIGGLEIRSYGVMVATAFLLSYWLTIREAKGKDYDERMLSNLLFLIIVSGIIGARLFYVTVNLPFYIDDPLGVIKIWEGGLVYYGGLLFSVISGYLYLQYHRVSVWRFADLTAPYLALGYGVGRIGCLLNGCCYGSTTIPIQIYSSITSFLIFLILLMIKRKKEFDGQVFFWYITLYSMARFVIEFFRTDPRGFVILDYLSTSQALGLVGILLSAFMMVKLKGRTTKA